MLKEFREMLGQRNWVVLDTETTGLDRPAEICEIAVVNWSGSVLLNTRLRPTRPIPPAATAVHGITDDMVAGSPQWPAVKPDFIEIIAGHDVVAYNAKFDRKLIHWTDEAFEFSHFDYHQVAAWHCAMLAYAEYHGEIDPYYGTYKWQGLAAAMRQMGLAVDGAHSAAGDCEMTRRLCQAMLHDTL
jgi:DNA polymerase-3 subunit epsilon